MRSILAGLVVVFSLSACGQKPAAGEGKECKALFDKCNSATDAAKAICDGKKADIETLKKTPNEETCKALAGVLANTPGAVPTNNPTPTPTPTDNPPSSAPAEGAGSAPTDGAGSAPTK